MNVYLYRCITLFTIVGFILKSTEYMERSKNVQGRAYATTCYSTIVVSLCLALFIEFGKVKDETKFHILTSLVPYILQTITLIWIIIIYNKHNEQINSNKVTNAFKRSSLISVIINFAQISILLYSLNYKENNLRYFGYMFALINILVTANMHVLLKYVN